MNARSGFGYAGALTILVLIAGCSMHKSEPVYAEIPGPSFAPASGVPVETVPATASPSVSAAGGQPTAEESKPELIVTPDTMLTGSVVSVSDVGRFAVLQFPPGRMPAIGSTLFVYRQGLKVAELKVSGPQKDDHTVADIRTGECRPKDEVRDQ